MRVEVVRSARRQRAVSARRVGDTLRVSIPASMTEAEERRWVDEMVRRLERRSATGAVDLEARARRLAARHALPAPSSVRWADDQRRRWGSCTPANGTVRISTAVAAFPAWVLDYVLVHELAHLAVPRHDAAFWALVARYPKAERARGFLIAKGLDDGEPDPGGPGRDDGDVDD